MNIIEPITVKNAVLTSSSVAENDFSAWAASTTYALGDKVIETSPSATVTMTIASPCVVSWTAHGRAANTPIVFTTTGALPTGLVSGTEYFIKALTVDTFELSETSGGAAINTTGSQSGTHTATTRVHKIYESLAGTRATVTMTIATPCVVTSTAHGLVDGAPISFTTTGALPTGLVSGTIYYVKSPATDTFNVAATSGGAAINTTGTQSGVHTATATPIAYYNKQPAINTAAWLDSGATNRWAMFDQVNTSQTHASDSIVVVLAPVAIANGVYLGGVEADTITVTVTDLVDGLVYTETQDMIMHDSQSSFFNWFFGRIKKKTLFVSLLLPMYANASISITLTKTGGIAKCSTCVVGAIINCGMSVYGLGTDIKDYSTTLFNSDGSSSTVVRGFAKRMSIDVILENDTIDIVQDALARLRQTSVVWVASTYESNIVFGKFSSFKNVVEGPTNSKMTLQIDGVI